MHSSMGSKFLTQKETIRARIKPACGGKTPRCRVTRMGYPLFLARTSWVLGACLLLPAVVTAEEPARPPAADSGNAAESDLLQKGRQARAARHWAEAETALEAALEPDRAGRLKPVERAEVMGEIGLCELEQRKYREAAEHLSRSLDHFLSLRPAVRRRFGDALAEALKHVGRVFFSADPPDAAVLLDGKPVGRAGIHYELFVDPGKHMIRARLDGHQDVVQVFDIDAGKKHQLSMHLPKAPPAAAGRGGVQVKAAASQEAEAKVKAASKADKVPWGPRRIALVATGGVVTTAVAVAGVVLLLKADSVDRDLDALNETARTDPRWSPSWCRDPNPYKRCAEARQLKTARDELAAAGLVVTTISGVLAASTVAATLWTKDPSRDSAPTRRVGVALGVGPGAFGLTVHGVW
jgi:PEGA domain